MTDDEGFCGQNERANQEVYRKQSIDPAMMILMIVDADIRTSLTRV